MTYVIREDNIDILPLSTRTLNCAHREEIHTVEAFLSRTEEEWRNTRNLGAKSLQEILQISTALLRGDGEFVLIEDKSNPPPCTTEETTKSVKYDPLTVYLRGDGAVLHDVPIERLAPSARALNALKKAGYNFASQLLGISEDNVKSIHNVGSKTVNEIMLLAEHLAYKWIEKDTDSDVKAPDESEKNCLEEELTRSFGQTNAFWLREILSTKSKYPEAIGETFIYRLYELDTVRDTVKRAITARLEESEGEMSKNTLEKTLPPHLYNTTITEEIMLELETAEKIVVGETKIKLIYPSIMKFIPQIENERDRLMLMGKLTGKTLDEIGQECGITRERVRQIISKALRALRIKCGSTKLHEDRYWKIFDQYLFLGEDFCAAFDEPPLTYFYLEIVCSKSQNDKLPLEKILTDESVSVDFRKTAEKIIYKDYVSDNGLRIKSNRPELVRHYVKQYCKELTCYDTFQDNFHQWLSEMGEQHLDRCILNAGSCKNALSTSDYVLWNHGSNFRYYNIKERDFDDLLEVLNLSQYHDVVLSTAKWFKDYPEIMKQYDLRDGCELHNLLKKLNIAENHCMTFGKMPTVTFGNGSVQNQIFDLMVENAPILADDLAQKYEEVYGVRADVLRGGTEIKSLNEYYHQGMYRIDQPSLTENQKNRMLELLDQDFYTTNDIKRLFRREFPDADIKLINAYSLKSLGFLVYTSGSGYVVRNTHMNASRFFKSVLTSNPIVDMRDNTQDMRNLSAFTTELYELRHEYEIIEFSPLQYININRLRDMGITKEALRQFCHTIAEQIEPGAYFSIESLQRDGFTHPLDDLGFDVWFYSSVLLEDTEHFTYQRIGGTRLFRRQRVLEKVTCTLGDMLREMLEVRRQIDFYDLHEHLEAYLGIKLSTDKLKEIIRETDLYYNNIMDTVYTDYDTYFEEI